MPRRTFGNFGESVSEALQTEFFVFFRLAESTREELSGGSVRVEFRPSGADVREMVACRIVQEGNQEISSVSLAIAGEFIDDARRSSLARDVARSFISRCLADEADEAVMAEVIRDLTYRTAAGPWARSSWAEQVVSSDRREENFTRYFGPNEAKSPELPAVVSRGYAVFTGTRKILTRNLTTKFVMQNIGQGQDRILTITFERLSRLRSADPGAGSSQE